MKDNMFKYLTKLSNHEHLFDPLGLQGRVQGEVFGVRASPFGDTKVACICGNVMFMFKLNDKSMIKCFIHSNMVYILAMS